ncbi:hypothetical protein [Nonomuraea harbinensis]|uniref:DUF1990 domain-containing protein n=1 Tax=Nonomuraea harbinensis TaxID=1286938 RepID=A0ABW1C9X2_9ACTN|nr:hypothetical protein [Nonomuraea harbinensis]
MVTSAARLIPRPDMSERHAILIDASRERVWEALTGMSADDVPLAKPLFAARSLVSRLVHGRTPQPGPGFTPLVVDPGREVVLGLIGQWWRLGRSEDVPVGSLETFEAFDRPGFAKGTFAFSLAEEGGRVRLTTETRVVATSPDALRAFRPYWIVIRPGSGLIRRLILSAVRSRALRS